MGSGFYFEKGEPEESFTFKYYNIWFKLASRTGGPLDASTNKNKYKFKN